MADTNGLVGPSRMFDDYAQRTYRMTAHGPQGLYMPFSTLSQVADELEQMNKADQRVKMMEAKVGSLFSYYYGIWSNMVTWGAAEKPRGTPSFKLLRQAAIKSQVDALIINARMHQVRHLSDRAAVSEMEKGWKVVHKQYKDPTFNVTPDIKKRCLEMENLIEGTLDGEGPNPEIHPTGVQDVILKAVQGELEIDRKAMVIGRSISGLPLSYHLLPPDGIKPRMEVLLSYMKKFPGLATPESAMKFIWDQEEIDLTNAAYVQILDDGRIYGAWSRDEISVDITSPSDEIDRAFYGVSSLERSLEVTHVLMRAFQYNSNLFDSGFPEAMLIFQGKVNQLGLEAFKKEVYSAAGPGGAQRLPMWATGDADQVNKAELVKIRDTLRDMNFPQLIRFFCALKSAAYRAHPSLINLSPDVGGQRPLIRTETQEDQIAMAQEEGLHSLLANTARWMTRTLIRPWYDDLKLIFTVQDAKDELEQYQLYAIQTQTDTTVNEIRAKTGKEPLEKVSGVDGNYIANPIFMQQKMMQQQEEMMAQQAAMAEKHYGEPGEDAFGGMEGEESPGGAPPGMQSGRAGGGPIGGGGGAPPPPGGLRAIQGGKAGPPVKKSLTITIERS